jgi:hypothetical protein
MMAIFDCFFRRKIKAVHYFTETDKQFDLPGITVQLSKLDSSADISTSMGGGNSHKKITIPDNADITKLAQLDMLQYSLAQAINALDEKDKQQKTKEYIDTLQEMFRLVSDNADNIKKKSVNENVNFKNLNKYLTDREFKSNGLPNNLSAVKDGYVIWPITLQPLVTYIHTAQIQLIKLLVSAGWKLHIIIGDCGKHSATVKDTSVFKNTIIALLQQNGITIEQQTVTLLSKYFKRDPSHTDSSLLRNVTSLELLNTFHTVSNSVQWMQYWDYVTKNYNKTKKEELKKRKILNNLQPLLNWTLVVTITKNYSKTIVVAGEDEQKQWDEIVKIHGNNKIGMIYIQELKKDNKTMDQSEISIGSTNDMQNKLNNGNMGQWLYNHFVELPKFLTDQKPSFCKISDNECAIYGSNCVKCLFDNNNKNFNDSNFDKNAFVSEIYQIANPANAII